MKAAAAVHVHGPENSIHLGPIDPVLAEHLRLCGVGRWMGRVGGAVRREGTGSPHTPADQTKSHQIRSGRTARARLGWAWLGLARLNRTGTGN